VRYALDEGLQDRNTAEQASCAPSRNSVQYCWHSTVGMVAVVRASMLP